LKTRKTGRGTRPIGKTRTTAVPRKYVLRLFVAGASDRSRQALLHVRKLCREDLGAGCELEVIDIYQQPELARENQIVATPTLIKEFPPPARRFIGNLLNIAVLFAEMELIPKVGTAL
jgi:circadian clock protein KaiB